MYKLKLTLHQRTYSQFTVLLNKKKINEQPLPRYHTEDNLLNCWYLSLLNYLALSSFRFFLSVYQT